MKTTKLLFVAAAFLVIGQIAGSSAQDTPKKEADPKVRIFEKPSDDAKAATKDDAAAKNRVRVEKGPLKIEVNFKGVIEAASMVEVSVKPEAWTGLSVLKAVEPGTIVKSGDTLVTFDTEKIDKSIRDMETEQRLADIMIEQAELDLAIAERTIEQERSAAERSRKQTEEDFRKFLDNDKPLSIESAEFGVKNARNFLENQQEELKQLQKMYRKDLTEETEEIILKRQKNAVEQAEFGLKLAENRRNQTVKVDLPRRETDMRESATRATISYERAMKALPLSLDQKRCAVQKAKYERKRGVERLDNLKKDRELFVVKAPADGLVYFGKCSQGSWNSGMFASRLQKGGAIGGDEVFMTIVTTKPVFIRGSVEEKDARTFAAGATCKVTPVALPDTKIAGKVERIATVPVGGNFEVRVAIDDIPDGVLPGMSVGVKVEAYRKENALTLPQSAVFEDDGRDDQFCVYRNGPDGKPEKKSVTLGRRSGGKVEILSGLKAGDEVLATKPGSSS